ncbi:MAG TPA: serine/threonine-protein kinase [Blastocatellia bacterium]|nr:serine/threonine-protein kinase [Blastocatellia bacterium]
MNPAHLIGQALDEKYQIEKQLGMGGMGAVYLATHLGTGRPVALKVITPQYMNQNEFVERFKREAKAAGRLRHPNVVDVTDFGFAQVGSQRVAYLVMEYLDGCSLADILKEESSLPLSWVIDILEQACSAVAEAHQQGIIHRDLKPDNIWLEPNQRGGYTVKVLDFGLAKLADTASAEGGEGAGVIDSVSAARAPRLHGVASFRTAARARDTAISESATKARSAPETHSPAAGEEENTLLLDAHGADTLVQTAVSEAPPQSRPPSQSRPSGEDERTQLIEPRATEETRGLYTASMDGITRVGSVLGTPVYMSPEQCRGEALDARSDIYSLGVIAYQMLTGRPPFSGDMNAVLKMHMEAAPPPLKVKRLPKKLSRLVMSALAKDPSERPVSAAAFSSALRARSEGAGTLVRKAMALFSEHMPIFSKVALLVYLPLIAITVLQIICLSLTATGAISDRAAVLVRAGLSIISIPVTMLIASLQVGVTTRLVTQVIAAPLRPLEIRPAFTALRKRLRPFTTTVMLVQVLAFLGILLGLIPGLIVMMNYTLVAPVVMMERHSGRAALARAKSLSKRARRTVAAIIFIQFVIPIVISLTISIVLTLIVKVLKIPGGVELVANIHPLIGLPLNILIGTFSSIITALLYLKTRQSGGETLKEALSVFEDESSPCTYWQRRMRERLSMDHGSGTRGHGSAEC